MNVNAKLLHHTQTFPRRPSLLQYRNLPLIVAATNSRQNTSHFSGLRLSTFLSHLGSALILNGKLSFHGSKTIYIFRVWCRASMCAPSSSPLRMLVSPPRKLRTPPTIGLWETRYFYAPPWYRETETTVLNLIHGELLAGNWVVGDQVNNREVLRGIRQEIRRVRLCPELGDVPIGVFLVKYSQWRRRYHIFTLLTGHPRVFYMPVLNNPPPRAPDSVWSVLLDVCRDVDPFELYDRDRIVCCNLNPV